MRFRAVPLLIVALSLCAPPGAWAEKTDVYAVVGARILPVSGPAVKKGTLVLRDGVIEALGADVVAPPDARVFDGSGLTLTPGLIDAFGGIGLPAKRAGGTSRQGPEAGRGAGSSGPGPLAPQADILDQVVLKEALEARDTGVTTALVVSDAGVLPGRSVILNLSGDSRDALVLQQPAALHLHMATIRRRYPGSLMGTMALARQALHDAAHYRDEWEAYRRAPLGRKRPRYDPGLEAWQDVLMGELPLVITALRENDIRRALSLAREFDVRVIAAGVPHASKLTETIQQRRLPLLVSVNFDPPRAGSGFSFRGQDVERERKAIEEARKNPAALHKAGVPFALVSGHARDFLAGVRTAVEQGLPRDAALRALTLSAAEILGLADRAGSLEVGKLANVVAWEGEPLDKESKVRMVFVDGKHYRPKEKDKPGKGDDADPKNKKDKTRNKKKPEVAR